MKERAVHSLQIIYSILEQDPAKDFFPIAADCEVGLLSPRPPRLRGPDRPLHRGARV